MYWIRLLIPVIVSVASALACYWAAGPTLGLFFGSLLLLSLLIPPLFAIAHNGSARIAWFLALIAFHAGTWYFAVRKTPILPAEIAASAVVLLNYCASLAAVTTLLNLAFPRASVGISALVTLIALGSLTWPIWMSRTWDGSASSAAIDRFLSIHPAMVINGQLLPATGPWTEQSIAYHLTDLNQDVPYTLPRRIAPCVFLHGGIAALCIIPIILLQRNKKRPTPLDANSSANTEKSANAV